MLALAILLLFNFLGYLAHQYAHVPLPANVIGMLLLLLALSLGLVKLKHVEPAANILLKHMMLLFAPLIVGTLALAEILQKSWAPLLATVIFSTLITLVVTAAVASLFNDSHPALPQEPPHE